VAGHGLRSLSGAQAQFCAVVAHPVRVNRSAEAAFNRALSRKARSTCGGWNVVIIEREPGAEIDARGCGARDLGASCTARPSTCPEPLIVPP